MTRAAMLAAALVALIVARPLNAQGCSTTCPQNNGCSGSYVAGCSGEGSDPVCYLSDPDPCRYSGNGGCPYNAQPSDGCCVRVSSPIILDLNSEGFHLTNVADGVWFRPYPKVANPFRVAWTERGSHNGWLALDRNNNGVIDDFGELFGNETPQPKPAPGKLRNGFAALAVFDQLEQGGNDDGWITREDAIFPKLRVWIDLNHDGISQPGELYTLDAVGVAAISLTYGESKRTDGNGNLFRFTSTVRDTAGGETSKIDYDVYLRVGQERGSDSSAFTPTAAFSRSLGQTLFHQR